MMPVLAARRPADMRGTVTASLQCVRTAVEHLVEGRPVLLASKANRRVDLLATADTMTPQLMAFLVRHSSGFVCVAMDETRADTLQLPPQTWRNQNRRGTALGVSVDAAEGIGTGISATDRSHTARLLAREESRPTDFTRPGHVVPLRAVPGGVLRRDGHTEAAVDLAGLTGGAPVAVLADLALDGDRRATSFAAQVAEFADTFGLVSVSVGDVVVHRWHLEPLVKRVAAARVPTETGAFEAVGYESARDDLEHIVFVHGRIDRPGPVPVHVHRESLIDDAFGAAAGHGNALSLRAALDGVVAAGRGAVIYLRSPMWSTTSVVRTLQLLAGDPAGAPELRPLAGAVCSQIIGDLGIGEVDLITPDRALRSELWAAGVPLAAAPPCLALANDAHLA